MKIQIREDSVVLEAETDHEREALKRLRSRGVESVKYEDDWDANGGLIFQHRTHPFDKK